MLSVLVAFLMLGSQCGAVMAEELVPDVGTTAIESDFAEEDLSFGTQEVLPAYEEEVLPSAEEELIISDNVSSEFEESLPIEDDLIQEEPLLAEEPPVVESEIGVDELPEELVSQDELAADIQDELAIDEISEEAPADAFFEEEEPQIQDEAAEKDETEIIEDALESGDDPALVGGSTMETATRMYFGSTYSGSITSSTSSQYYKLILPSSGRVTLEATAYMRYLYYYLYNSDGSRIDYWYVSWDSAAGKSVKTYTLDLEAGTYYWGVVRYSSYTGSYRLSASFTSANESFSGSDNYMETANRISLDSTYRGQVAINDDKDFYRFTLNSSGKLKLYLTAYMQDIIYYLYDSKGNRIDYWYAYWDSNSGKSVKNIEMDLSSGTYYLGVIRYSSSYTGNYSFKVSLETLPRSWITKLEDIGSGGVRVYWKQLSSNIYGYQIRWSTDSSFKSGVKTASYTDRNNAARENLSLYRTYYFGVRTYVVTNGKKVYSKWSSTKSLYLSRTLPTPSIWYASNYSGKIEVDWDSVSGVDGYQLKYARNSDFTDNKRTASFSGRYREVAWKSYFSTYYTWYVSIRSYKTASDGTRYYSKWSPARMVY